MKKFSAQEFRNYLIGLIRSGNINEEVGDDGAIILITDMYKHSDGSIHDEPEDKPAS
jgi:hypothetical protein